MNRKTMSVLGAMVVCGVGLSAWGGVTLTDFIGDSNSNTNQWELSETEADASNGRKFSNDGESITSPIYDGAVVSITFSAKNVNFRSNEEKCRLRIEAKTPASELWTDVHQLVFASGSATNETVSFSRSADYRQFRIVFLKGYGTMRVSSFMATWRVDGEVPAPTSLKASEVTSDSFYATWEIEEPVEGFLFDCWRESMTSWTGDAKWREDFSSCVNEGGSPKEITDDLGSAYGLDGWSGDSVYLSAGCNGTIQINKATEGIGWLITEELQPMEDVELVVRACAFAMQADHVMPVYIIRSDTTNELASFELTESFADYHCPIPKIHSGDRLAFKSFSSGTKRRVHMDSVALVEGFAPGYAVTNPVCESVAAGYSDSPGFHVEELDPDGRYSFSVRAVSGGIQSERSEVCSVVTAPSEEEAGTGGWAGAVASEITHTSFRLGWSPVHGASGYRVSVWTNVLEGASSGVVWWSEPFSKAMASSSKTAISDSEEFNESYADNMGWTILSNVFPSVDLGTVRLGNTMKPGELQTPPMEAFSGGILRVKVRRQATTEGAIFSVFRQSGGVLSEIGEAQKIGDEFAEYVWSLQEMNAGDCIVFRSASGKSQYRTILDEVTILKGYSEGVSEPDYTADKVAVEGTAYAMESLASCEWTFAVEALDSAGAVISASTNTVDLANPPPRPVIDAVSLSEMRRRGRERIWSEDFSSFANVFPKGKNTVDWLNGTTLAHWQAYCGGEPVTVLKRNFGGNKQTGLYAYWAAGEIEETYSLGTMMSGQADQYVYGLSFVNDTAFSVRKIAVGFDGMQFGFNNNEVQDMFCEYLVTNELASVAVDGDWRICDSLTYRTTKDSESGLTSGVDMPVATALSAEIPDINVPAGSYFMIRWRRNAVSNSAAMAIDNVSVVFTSHARPLTVVIR